MVGPVIQHVALETARTDAAVAEEFWQLLGFEPVEPPETLRDRAAWLQKGPTQVHLLWSDEPLAPPASVLYLEWLGAEQEGSH